MAAAGEEKTAAVVATVGRPILQRRIEFHPAKRPYNGFPCSSGDFRLETLNPSSLDSQRAAPAVSGGDLESLVLVQEKRSAVGELYQRGFDPELSFRIRFQKIGAGLENLGNTCYLNSVLQCLTYTEPFAAYLQSGKHKSICRTAGFCAMCALQNHVMDALRSSGKILRPFHLVRNLRCISRNFRISRQEDAHEYMVNLLESMHKCCLPYGVPSESTSAYDKSLVHKIFGGQLRSQVKCLHCAYCSNKFDPFLDLSLEIVRADSLWKALAHFTAVEQLDGGGREYQCQRCNEKVRASKQLTIHKAPYVLTIHLKRFGSSIRGEKIDKKIEFGSTLDLKPFVSGPHEENLRYTLYGVLVHAGWSTHSGHYFCYVRTSAGLWYSLDDNQVSQVSEKTVLSREAYMLFYVRDRSTIKLSTAINHNADISSNACENKGSTLAERRFSNADSSDAKAEHNDTVQCGRVSLMDVSRLNLFKNKVSRVENNSHVKVEGSCLQVDADMLSQGLHQKVLSDDPTKSIGSICSKIPFVDAKKGNVINEAAQDSATQHKMENNYISDSNDIKKSLNLANAVNVSVQNEAAGALSVELPDKGKCNVPDTKNCGNRPQTQKVGEGFKRLLEAKPVKSQSLSASNVQKEGHAVPNAENSIDGGCHSEVKPSKSKKPSIVKGSYFGRKQLFFMSLRWHEKKLKKTRRRHLNSRDKLIKKMVDEIYTDSQGASTSQTLRFGSVGSGLSPEKLSYSTSEKKPKGTKTVKLFDHDSNQMNGQVINRSCITDIMPMILEQPNMSSCSIEGRSTLNIKITDKNIIPICPASLLKTSLKEHRVARWDTEDLPTFQLNEIQDSPKRNIGYVLDEWDEEYDKGKRKKLKKPRLPFGGPNPFQQTAFVKTQQKTKMKGIKTSSIRY